MSNVNTTVVSGNLTRDPELKWLAEDGSKGIVNIGIAVNRTRKDADGNFIDEVSYFDIDVFGGFSLLVAKKLRKGDSATIQGRLEQQRWETSEGNRSKVIIIAEQIDSEGFFRAKEEDAAVAIGASSNGASAQAEEVAATSTAGVGKDDIPF